MRLQLLVIAKQPIPGRVKTRLCPPCTPQQAAAVADAALRDTLDAVSATPAARRTLVVHGTYRPPPAWAVVAQRGNGLGERLANAFADTARPGTASLLVGMDTPQLDGHLLAQVASGLDSADAVLGAAEDGGWWVLALRDPYHAVSLIGVPMSTSGTGADTVLALRRRGLTVTAAPSLRDVDTAADAWAVAQAHPGGRFAAAVRRHVPTHREAVAR